MDEISNLIKDAGNVLTRAVKFDQEQNFPVAVYFYFEAIYVLERAKGMCDEAIRNREGKFSQQVIDTIRRKGDSLQIKINEYRERANSLQRVIQENEESEMAKSPKKTEQELQIERAYFLVGQALQEDEQGHDEEAVELYTQAVQVCLAAKSTPSIDEKTAAQVFQLATKALDRAEKLKGITKEAPANVRRNLTEYFDDMDLSSEGNSFQLSQAPNLQVPARAVPAASSSAATGGSGTPGKGGYTDKEKKVLLQTSIINGREYVPFMSIDLGERFAYPIPFTDKDGRLKLSPKQRKNFKEWARPSDLWPNSKMIEVVSCYSIKQTVISDCSFVASLAVSALYEKRFNTRLITSIIYPQNKAGEPVINPCGKYMIKLHINGVKRKVIIDDLLPVGQHNELLCSYSSNKGELWVSFLEKAYMKVMGGYDFPGSNSNIDLHALTGWIPERVPINPQDKTTVFNKEDTFRMLHHHMNKGNVLVTVATGEMNESEAERAGLVTCHAYALLDIQVVKGVKLIKLKNPWSHLRWRGNYSELDVIHWTDELKSLLNYDPNSASMFDNGVFWIDYDSILKFFDVFYLNWNPRLFANTDVIHSIWAAGTGPVKDVYNIGENPQYCLEVASKGDAVVWVLLTRHITEIQDFKENREYITVLVYDTNGNKVYYPHDPPPLIDGARINSPHYLCKIKIDKPGKKRYTLVISQYEKINNIYYTLRAYSTCPLSLKEIINPYKHKKKITGEWKGKTAGGCGNHPATYPNNPCYQITLNTTANDNKLLIDLRARKDFQVGFDIVCSNVSTGSESSPGFFNKKSSGPYRPGFVILELDHVPSGVYNIIPSTYLPNMEGAFFLTIQTSCDFGIKLLQ